MQATITALSTTPAGLQRLSDRSGTKQTHFLGGDQTHFPEEERSVGSFGAPQWGPRGGCLWGIIGELLHIHKGDMKNNPV